jgi:hypothetical protein
LFKFFRLKIFIWENYTFLLLKKHPSNLFNKFSPWTFKFLAIVFFKSNMCTNQMYKLLLSFLYLHQGRSW